MSGLEIALLAVMGTLFLGGCCVGAVFYFRWRAKQAAVMNEVILQLAAVLVKYQGSLDLYLASIDKAKTVIDTVPVLLTGMIKIAATEVKEINAFREEVKNFRDMIFRKEGKNLDMPSDAEKDFMYRATELAREKGIGVDQALRQVLEEDARGESGESVEFSLGV